VRAYAHKLSPRRVAFKRQPQLKSLIAEVSFLQNPHQKIWLALPTTYMNDSGRAVSRLLAATNLTPGALVIVHDDKDLAWRQIKFQFKRGAAGHRGVLSIIKTLHTRAFYRLRVGLGSPGTQDTNAFVLSKFTKEEWSILQQEIIPRALALLTEKLSLLLSKKS
jgi:PTH1 family peptidyl-tRNA hydrolase